MTLCDIGNTTFAFLHKDKKFKVSVNTNYENLPKIKNKIYFISVNKKASKKFLKKYPKAINLEKFLNINTSYSGIGIDRKIAFSNIKNGIIVDVGSAITVDIVKNGDHKGGFILSGIKKLISFYPQISPKLKFKFNPKVNLYKLPLNTNDAISYAILKSIITPIKDIEKLYRLKIYFTGEDAVFLIKHFANKKYKKNLIFNSMKKIIAQIP